MSSSFLNPSVTPATALATRLRARPWNFPSSGFSPTVFACRCPSASSKLMPEGNACRILPFGPCTSTAPSTTLTVTPFGIVIGFLPIRDILCLVGRGSSRAGRGAEAPRSLRSPHVTQHFAADAGLHRRAAGHDASRRPQNARPQPCQDVGHIVASEVDAAAGTADALEAGDEPLAVRSVLEEQPQHPGRPLGRILVEELEALDVAFVLQDARDVRLDARRRHVDARMFGDHRVADP